MPVQMPGPLVGERSAIAGLADPVVNLRVACRRTETHHNIFGPQQHIEPGGRRADISSTGSARLPTMIGWMNSTETCWASVA